MSEAVEISDYAQGDTVADRERLAAIVDSSDDAIISKDLNGIITSWNKGAERIFGYAAAEIIGKPVTILIPQDRLQEEPKIIEQLKQGKRVDHFQTIRRHKSGKFLDISLTISPIKNKEGRIVGASKVARDISEQKRTVRELEAANRELARTNEDLEQFSFIASHDLKEPVRNILTYVQILKEDHPATGQVAEYRDEIIAACARMNALIRDLLVYTETRTEQAETDESADLNLVMRSVKETLKAAIAESGAKISVPELPVITGKTAHFESFFKNLIVNAIKYRSSAAPDINITVEKSADKFIIAVTDNGIGIDEKHFKRYSCHSSGCTAAPSPGPASGWRSASASPSAITAR